MIETRMVFQLLDPCLRTAVLLEAASPSSGPLEGRVLVLLCLAARCFSRACVLALPDPCRLRGRALPAFFLDLQGNHVQLVIADVHNAQVVFASAAMTGLCCAILESTNIDSLLKKHFVPCCVAWSLWDRHT